MHEGAIGSAPDQDCIIRRTNRQTKEQIYIYIIGKIPSHFKAWHGWKLYQYIFDKFRNLKHISRLIGSEIYNSYYVFVKLS